MSDFGNIYGSYETANNELENGFYGCAAEEFWYTEQYYEHGEFPIYDSNIEKMASIASNQWRKIISTHLKTATLSKSSFVMGCQCTKLMWLHKYKYAERKVSVETQSKFDRGHIIGELAQHLFPDGIDASDKFNNVRTKHLQAKTPFTISKIPYSIKQQSWIELTEKLLKQKIRFIYEAAFKTNDVFSALDILAYEDGNYIAYEVKSTDHISDIYLTDAALQYYVINEHVPLKDIFLVYLNKEYVEELNTPLKDLTLKNCDIHKLFVKESILPQVLERQDFVKENISTFKKVLANSRKSPNVAPGDHCQNPYECPFAEYCQS